MATEKLNVGLLGCGNVGRGLVELVARNRELIRQRSGVELHINKILVREMGKRRPGVDRDLLTTDPDRVIDNGCDLVVELVGGVEPARSFIKQALAGGKHVVTANKALLALDGFTLMKAAESQNVRLGFEASVCGGIPIIRALRNGLVGNSIESLNGILNGTCNYILTRMEEARLDFESALQEAQSKGFAEADPTLDIDGHDAAQKLKILAELAFQAQIAPDAVQTEGIRNITADDIQAARELGYIVKHIASAELKGGRLSLSVHPAMLPRTHQLATIREEKNAVLVRGDAVGEMLFTGKGAGSMPSASAVLSDVVDIACHTGGFSSTLGDKLTAASVDYVAQHYLRFVVSDPSAIGPITAMLQRNGIGVTGAAALWAKTQSGHHQVRVLTQRCSRTTVEQARQDIEELNVAKGDGTLLRVLE